jgi:hypothetical protein
VSDLGQHAQAAAECEAALRSSISILGEDHFVTRELTVTLDRIRAA